ncbi:hypothetical protein ES703_38479 [subsurface metagenome]
MGDYDYDSGTSAPIIAKPDEHYEFVSWTGTGVIAGKVTTPDANGTEIMMDADYAVQANFEQLPRDDFNDNRRGATWRTSTDDPESTMVVEDVNRLNVKSIGDVNMAASCVGHWPMNDNDGETQVDDISGNNNHGTAQQITSDLHTDSGDPPDLNGALAFNGSSDYIATPMTNFPAGAAARSASLWIQWDGSSGYRVIFGYGDNASGAKLFGAFLDSSGNLYFWNDYQNAANNYDTGIDIASGEWTHIVLTYDGTNVKAYKNAAWVDTTARALDTVLEASAIGRNAWSGSFYFAGSIDNVMIFDKALSQEEISYLYNNGDGTETIPAGGGSGSAYYVANGWDFDVAEDFEVKVDFHYSDTSSGDGWVEMALENTEDNYVSLSAGFDGSEAYFYYEKVVDGSVVNGQVSRASDDGTLYISYDANSDELYLSSTGYGSGNAWQIITGLLAGQWSSEPVNVAIGGGSELAGLEQGEAYLDNFEVTAATLFGWPPATDIDDSGFIDWGDIGEMSAYWLATGSGIPADVDNDGIVNFVDFAEVGLAW